MWQMRVQPFDPASSFSTSTRLQTMLRDRACLEKAMFHNAAVIGAYIQQLRQELSAQDPHAFDRTISGLFRAYTPVTDRAGDLLRAFENVYALAEQQPSLHDDITVRQWLQQDFEDAPAIEGA
jgi:hypothetical protein